MRTWFGSALVWGAVTMVGTACGGANASSAPDDARDATTGRPASCAWSRENTDGVVVPALDERGLEAPFGCEQPHVWQEMVVGVAPARANRSGLEI